MAKKTTIADVAKLAGVGKVTVSYVLNGQAETARISKSTVAKVQKAAADLQYRPNALARMLVRKKADAIGVVFQYGDYFGSQSSFINEVLRSVCQSCVDQGVDVMLHTKAANDPCQEANALSDGRVDSVIVIRDEHDPVHELLLERNFPAVLFFCRSDDPRAAFVACDNYNGGRSATNHLLSLGHSRIAMVRGGLGSVDSNDRFNGYRSAMEAAGIGVDPRYVVPFHAPGGNAEAFLQMMQLSDRPTAIFAWSDDTAIECIRLLSQIGLSVPEDVSVVGFDGTPAGERSTPSLTTVRQPIEEITVAAVTMAVQLALAPSQVHERQLVFTPNLIVRESTGPVPLASTPPRIDNEVNLS